MTLRGRLSPPPSASPGDPYRCPVLPLCFVLFLLTLIRCTRNRILCNIHSINPPPALWRKLQPPRIRLAYSNSRTKDAASFVVRGSASIYIHFPEEGTHSRSMKDSRRLYPLPFFASLPDLRPQTSVPAAI